MTVGGASRTIVVGRTLIVTRYREGRTEVVCHDLKDLVDVLEYARYHNDYRWHMSLNGDAPARRDDEPPENGTVIIFPRLGGLHHRYTRRAP